eukprot:SAG11_NODE_16143_length_555_cov_170.364035_1_plen_105_part_00
MEKTLDSLGGLSLQKFHGECRKLENVYSIADCNVWAIKGSYTGRAPDGWELIDVKAKEIVEGLFGDEPEDWEDDPGWSQYFCARCKVRISFDGDDGWDSWHSEK